MSNFHTDNLFKHYIIIYYCNLLIYLRNSGCDCAMYTYYVYNYHRICAVTPKCFIYSKKENPEKQNLTGTQM